MSMAWLLNQIKHIHSRPHPKPGTERMVNGVPSIYVKAGKDIHVHSALPACPRCGERDNLIEDDGRVICGYCNFKYDIH